MRVLVTGAHGFLGWHTSVRLNATTGHDVIRVGRGEWPKLASLVKQADAIVHIAGLNRGSDVDVRDGNVRLANDLADALRRSDHRPSVIYANSTQAEADTPYGAGKREASRILAETTASMGSTFSDVVLPNLFGEHGRPGYNSFVATFTHAVVDGKEPSVVDRDIELLHVQRAAAALIERIADPQHSTRPVGTQTSVGAVLHTLRRQFELYRSGDIPSLSHPLDAELFNTLRAAMFPGFYPVPLLLRKDKRGTLVETVRAHGSEGQTFFSTTLPGVTRGQHFHLRKFERFVVIDGEARISLRRALSTDVVSFDVSGSDPVIVDMPTLWVHKIENIGNSVLTTMFWANELFNADDPDTYSEDV